MLDGHLIAETRPQANAENVIFWKNYRVTVLQNRLFRIERSEEKRFRDDATQSVWFRDMPPQKFTAELGEHRAEISTDACTLILKEARDDCRIRIDGRVRKIDNSGNLKGTYRTLDCWDGDTYELFWSNEKKKIPLGEGVCSRTGVAVFDDAPSLTLMQSGEVKAERGSGTDEYVFAYGTNYREAVKALYLITGEVPMIPRFAFGNWWSRYHAYDEREYLRLLNRFEENDVPLTVATIDMDWHYSDFVDEEKGITAKGRNTPFYGGNSGWTGYSWNKKLFPEYRSFLQKVSAKNLKITLNLHPAEGVRWWEDCYEDMANAMGRDASSGERIPFDVADPLFINNYFSVIHKPYEADGVSFWWIDWQQGTDSRMQGLDPLWALNHYHYLDHAKNHAAPLILSRYAGIGSHRYPLGFSGDTYITWKTLKYLPYFTLTASNVGYTWWSHDIGGHHFGKMNCELYVRHVQFGVFSPINRLHCSNMETMTKEPWVYRNGSGKIIEDWLRLRHRMIPFLYSCCYRTHADGFALIEPLYYFWPECKEAYEAKEEYLFGGELLVVPVTSAALKDGYARVKAWIPEGRWTDIFTGDCYISPAGGETRTLLRTLDSIPVLAKEGAILPFSGDRGNRCENPARLDVYCYRGKGEFTLFEDGAEEEKEGGFFTGFFSEYQDSEGTGVQSLRIYSHGDAGFLPENRRLCVHFADISEGEICLYADGERMCAEEKVCDCACVEFAFEPGKEYRIEVKFRVRSSLEETIGRAHEVLLRTEGDNWKKFELWAKLKQAKDLEEYERIVDGAEIGGAAKLRLKETLPLPAGGRN